MPRADDTIEPFRSAVPDVELAALRARLASTRWPEAETVDDWSQGVPLAVLRDLCRTWAEHYDWRAGERRLNAVPQFRTTVDGLGIHFVHARSPHEGALPLVLTNGWPGSVFEFLRVIEPLTHPEAHGGSARDAFHVVCPTLPGYGFSDKPGQAGWGIERIADAWLTLMQRLGYPRFGAQGSDWGASITTVMARRAPERLTGIHLMPPLVAPDPATFDDLTDAERSALAALEHAASWEDGYSAEQSTKPQTIGYALTDSPAALCAWIAEKYASWADGGLDAIDRDVLLDTVTLYWLTATGASSARLYWQSIREVQNWFSPAPDAASPTAPGLDRPVPVPAPARVSLPAPVSVPTGCSVFPAETIRPSRRWAETMFTDIRWWGEPARGGHFPALEQPELFVTELRGFFRRVR
ncbi:epoxide hydrolase family protein [Herbiconiux daphne]|uniref:Epoxide hydrolase 1 n=1 Tax=Herbiconiux daphne TaxID=2970914 RepID=A0ABT2H2C7_9MICO|nr:epoxide hydrolase family protein [Herbiconiux daphne]MCS5734113.1 epoxide hydrolase 1 [Herbiconiux daphne]